MITALFGIFYEHDDHRTQTGDGFFLDAMRAGFSGRCAALAVGGLKAIADRRGDDDDTADNDQTALICVGEVFLSEKGASLQGTAPRRLRAPEICRLYEEHGAGFAALIKGDYQLVMLAKAEKKLEIYNGRGSVSPLYYHHETDRLAFSTSLASLQRYCGSGLDLKGIAEYSIFGFPLGELTFFRGIKSLQPAHRLEVEKGRRTVHEFWNELALLCDQPVAAGEALAFGRDLFKKVVSLHADGPDRINVSLTGGFDGRAILSALDIEARGHLISAYSFGISGSVNIKIPMTICREEGLAYRPIYLDGEYEDRYNDYGQQAIMRSDCQATFERANYPYAFGKIGDFSTVTLTGIFGSELMRTFQNVAVGNMISPYFIGINFTRDKRKAIRAACEKAMADGYYAGGIFLDQDDLVEHIHQECIERYGSISDRQRFFLFMFRQSARRYFGGEVQMEKPCGTNRFPFYDDDLVDFICRTRLAGVFRNPIRPTIKDRLDSQVFYAAVMKKFRPSLLEYRTDHGYAPSHLIAPASLLRIGPLFVLQKMRQKLTGYREFRTEEWSSRFYRDILTPERLTTEIFNERFREDHRSHGWRKRPAEFARSASLAIYLDLVRGERKHAEHCHPY